MCVIKTAKKLFRITNYHVLMTYEKHKAEKPDIFCQLGSAPFDPIANQMSRSEHWDLATFSIPDQTLQHMNYRVWTRDSGLRLLSVWTIPSSTVDIQKNGAPFRPA
jgi:hypothetical protein